MTRKAKKPQELNPFFHHLEKETERACAVLGTALVDSRLKDLFKRRLIQNQKMLVHLLDFTGPLSEFGVRIHVARALAWIDGPAAEDLQVIAKVRNRFAHVADHTFSFASDEIKGLCAGLRSSQGFLAGIEDRNVALKDKISAKVAEGLKAKFGESRIRYQVAVESLTWYLDKCAGKAPV